jgi:thioredoxin 1
MPFPPHFRFLLMAFVSSSLLTAGLHGTDAPDVPASKPTLPRLIDLGAGKCIPCKQMKPILDDLTRNYAGQFEVVFIDVWENREQAAKYGIRIIPTQIFYAADGTELSRHEGFLSKKDILATWAEIGVPVAEPAPPTSQTETD